MKKTIARIPYKTMGFIGVFCAAFLSQTKAETTLSYHLSPRLDSVGVEIVKGEVIVIHRVEAKETYYQLGRKYGVSANTIMRLNSKKSLKPGDNIKIPTGRKPSPAASSAPQEERLATAPTQVLTTYNVGKSETLYAISRRFNTSVEEIKKLNNLTSNSLREGQVLRIPDSDYTPPIVVPQEPLVVAVEEPTIDVSTFETNKFGIREKKEKGIGVWMENLEGDGKSNLALHKFAPVGTILKITNPMTQNVTYAKVVGKFTDNADTQDAIVVLSKSAAAYIGALDRRFLIEIAYGVPLQ